MTGTPRYLPTVQQRRPWPCVNQWTVRCKLQTMTAFVSAAQIAQTTNTQTQTETQTDTSTDRYKYRQTETHKHTDRDTDRSPGNKQKHLCCWWWNRIGSDLYLKSTVNSTNENCRNESQNLHYVFTIALWVLHWELPVVFMTLISILRDALMSSTHHLILRHVCL